MIYVGEVVLVGWIKRSTGWCEVDLQYSSRIGAVQWFDGAWASGVAMRCFVAVKREALVWWSQKEWNQRKGGEEW